MNPYVLGAAAFGAVYLLMQRGARSAPTPFAGFAGGDLGAPRSSASSSGGLNQVVAGLQTALNGLHHTIVSQRMDADPWDRLSVDGDFGPATQEAYVEAHRLLDRVARHGIFPNPSLMIPELYGSLDEDPQWVARAAQRLVDVTLRIQRSGTLSDLIARYAR